MDGLPLDNLVRGSYCKAITFFRYLPQYNVIPDFSLATLSNVVIINNMYLVEGLPVMLPPDQHLEMRGNQEISGFYFKQNINVGSLSGFHRGSYFKFSERLEIIGNIQLKIKAKHIPRSDCKIISFFRHHSFQTINMY